MFIFHVTEEARKGLSWIRAEVATVLDFDKNFELVADVNLPDDIDLAFQLTNSIEDNWWEHPGVTKGSKEGYRSTSVGDVIELSDGTYHMVDGSGWVEVFPHGDIAKTKVTSIIREAAFQVEFINSKHFCG